MAGDDNVGDRDGGEDDDDGDGGGGGDDDDFGDGLDDTYW